MFLSVLTTYKKRKHSKDNISAFIKNIKKNYPYNEILIIEQDFEGPIRKGALWNIGYLYSKGDVLALQDIDIRVFSFMDINSLLSYNDGVIPFDTITQIKEMDTKIKKIKTEKRLGAFGGINILSRETFASSKGFSNLIMGWGAEDNLFAERAGLKRKKGEIYHVWHPTLRPKNKTEFTKKYKYNLQLYKTDKNRNSEYDSYLQTSYSINSINKIEESNIKHIKVKEIGVVPGFTYIDLYNKQINLKY